jgi:hypothetical protein
MHRIAAIRRMRRGYVLTHHGEVTSRAEVLAERTGRRDLLVDLLWAEWAAATTACDHASADRLATQLLDLGRRSPEPEFAAVGEGAWGVFCFHQGRVAEAREYLDRAVASGRGLEPGDGLWEHVVISSSFHLLAHEISDEVSDGDAWLAELVERHPEPYQRLILGMFGALGATIAGDAARAERAARAALAATPEQSFPFFTAATEILLGSSLVEQGAVDEGIGLMTQGGLRYRNPNVRVIVPFYVALRARANARAGNHERALATIDDAARRLAESGERWPAPFLLIDEAEVRHVAGADTAQVVELLRQAQSLATAQGARAPARQAEERASRLGVALD